VTYTSKSAYLCREPRLRVEQFMRDRQSYAPFADTQPCSRIMDIRPKSQVTVTIQPSIEITGTRNSLKASMARVIDPQFQEPIHTSSERVIQVSS